MLFWIPPNKIILSYLLPSETTVIEELNNGSSYSDKIEYFTYNHTF